MSTEVSSLFFVKVEGRAHSNHRSPEGIYGVAVVAERSVQHSACAAMMVARDQVPFFSENAHAFTVRVFKPCGTEVVIPRELHTQHEALGHLQGRAKNPPESIFYQ